MSGRPRPGATSGRRTLPSEVTDLVQRGLLPPVGSMARLHGRGKNVRGEIQSYAVVDERIHVLIARAERDEDDAVHATRRLVRLEAIDVCSWDVEAKRSDRALSERWPVRRRGGSTTAERHDPDGDLVDLEPVDPVEPGDSRPLADAGEAPMWLLLAVAMLAVLALIAGVGGGFDGRVIVAGVLGLVVGPALRRRLPAWLSYRDGVQTR